MTARRRRWPIYFAIAAGYLFAAQTIAFAALAAADAGRGEPGAVLCQNGRAPEAPQRHSDAVHCLVACAAFNAAAGPTPEFALPPTRNSIAAAQPPVTRAPCSATSAQRTPHNPRAPPRA